MRTNQNEQLAPLLIALLVFTTVFEIWCSSKTQVQSARESTITKPVGSMRVPVVNAKAAGAKGDGKTDDTEVLQGLIDSLNQTGGGTIYIPAGNYKIDTKKALWLKSHVDVVMPDSTAQLTAFPSDTTRFYILMIASAEDIKIKGGKIKGERFEHIGTKGEWGMGIAIYASHHITIDGTIVADCWGDGIVAGAQTKYKAPGKSTNINIKNVISHNNRRQGLSIGKVDGFLVDSCKFLYTGGTKPMGGIDIEPDSDTAQNITIRNSEFGYNQGPGIVMYARSPKTPPVSVLININVHNNYLHHNSYGSYITRARNVVFTNNRMVKNKYGPAVYCKDTVNCVITPNETK